MRAALGYRSAIRDALCTCPQALVVILIPEVSDELLTHDPAQGVLQLHRLNEQIVLGGTDLRA